jgi:hypothetical protein
MDTLSLVAWKRIDTTQIESLNPYASDPERTRWRAGFTSALVAVNRAR